MKNEQRFTGKANVYEVYRPSYPLEVIDYIKSQLVEHGKETNQYTIADIGAGTGKFTALLLEAGFNVIAVEPNIEMANKLEKLYENYPSQLEIKLSTAEETTILDCSVDAITCAQAFHWVNAEKAYAEWKRILKANGLVALIWNQRATKATPFMLAYEGLFLSYDCALEESQSYKNVGHKSINVQSLTHFFGKIPQCYLTPYIQLLDEQGLIGRVTSSSYSIKENDIRYEQYIDNIKHIFYTYETDGYVTMHYESTCYISTLF